MTDHDFRDLPDGGLGDTPRDAAAAGPLDRSTTQGSGVTGIPHDRDGGSSLIDWA